ncbi:MAG: DMT family transporter [Defluviicoccus sp.]|nr:DMT family transporter [Defluviicoccus sp.]MDE0386454.1 DMT family transporter [Defluviicoccus sp.]
MSLAARHNPVVGVLWMFGAAVAFSVALALVRHLSATYSTFEIVVFRLIFGIVVLLPWLARVGRAGLRTNNLRLYAVRAAFAYSAMFCGYYAVRLITIADAVALQFTLPIFTLIFAVILLKERAYAHRWIATVLGFVGVLIIVRPGFAEVNAGVAIALAAALLFGVVDVSTRFLARDDGIRTILFYGFVMQVPIAAIPAAVTWVTPTLADLPWILAFATAALGAQICITKSLAAAEASLVSPVLYLRLPMVALIGFVFFDELPSVWTWVGAALLFGCTYYCTWRDARMTRSA